MEREFEWMLAKRGEEEEWLQVVRNGARGMALVGEGATKEVAGFVEEAGACFIDVNGGASGELV